MNIVVSLDKDAFQSEQKEPEDDLVLDIPPAERARKGKTVEKKHRKRIDKCPHQMAAYYANGMCKNCYHSKGRKKMASQCGHGDRLLYAKGQCKNCYLSSYHKNKTIQRNKLKEMKTGDDT